ncbi:MAG: glycosyltransferase family 39 protein [Candidatus Omnitrophica bacterium]|nr:glycosyltransferase family 39 protein [Candidatus Omnitrophota bacterium]
MDKKSLFLILGVFFIVLLAGVLSEPCLGDEVFHYRFAQGMFESHARPTVDAIYRNTFGGYFYNTEPLWHFLLAVLWFVAGGISPFIAQIYHASYTLLLLLGVYFLARHLLGENEAFYSVLLTATCPMMVAFGILFYVDIAEAAFLILSFLFLLRRKIAFSAVFFALACLFKITVLLFLPAWMFIMLWDKRHGFWERSRQFVFFVIPSAVLMSGEMLWRKSHLGATRLLQGAGHTVNHLSFWEALKRRVLLQDWGLLLESYSNSSLLNLMDVLKYFGVPLLILIVMYFLMRQIPKKRHSVLWMPIIVYLLGFCYIFHPASDIRYLLVLVPFLGILAATVAVKLMSRFLLRVLLVSLCLFQMGGAAVYVAQKRQVTPGIQEGFDFIQETVPEGTLVIYSEMIILEKTNRGYVWANHLFRDQLRKLFWGDDKKEVIDFMMDQNIRYLAVKKDRIYDDSNRHHFGGYPQSFVKQLGAIPYFKKVFENDEMAVWFISASGEM